MDPVSQGLLGTALSGTFAQKKEIRFASFCGFIGGIAPDIDILILISDYDDETLLKINEYFIGSIDVIPIR